MLRTILLCFLVSFSVPAMALYKCKSGDSITYSDKPCAGGETLGIGNLPAADTLQARRQAAEEQKQLKRLENERRKRDAQDDKNRQRAMHDHAVKQKRCTSLALRKKWATESVAEATGKSSEKAKQKLRRAEEQFETECKV
jgi:hypothetical protein